jgi:prophage regulatory protein
MRMTMESLETAGALRQGRQECFLRLSQVEKRVGLKKSSIYERIERGEFPAPVEISAKCSRWLESEIDSWIAERIKASREAVR